MRIVMKNVIKFFPVLWLLFLTTSQAEAQNDYPIVPVSFKKVKIHDAFWTPRIETNRRVTIPFGFLKCETEGRIENFVMAAKKNGTFRGVYPFNDTDVYKMIEGAAYSISLYPDSNLQRYVDSVITMIAAAQEPDGYLYTARTIDPDNLKMAGRFGKSRWELERFGSHELYNAGHLYEAAVAWYQATGNRNMLDIAFKNADLLTATFGPGKIHDTPGHQITEMGLVKLYRVTGKKEYLDLAKFFLDDRGTHEYPYDSTKLWKRPEYNQDHKPVIEQDEAVGHAVRAGYMYAGMADVAALTGDARYIKAIDRIWDNVAGKKYYITGGVGAIADGEAYGGNYELPNLTAYCETCASIALVYWQHRMFLLHGDGKYIDMLERTLYNALIAGVSLEGNKFFYTNPLASDGKFKFNEGSCSRSPWFECSCCPTNVARFLPSLGEYIYAVKNDTLYVNLFISNHAQIQIAGRMVEAEIQTGYPWNGNVEMTFKGLPKGAVVAVRSPYWASGQPVKSDLYRYSETKTDEISVSIDGKKISAKRSENGYIFLTCKWTNEEKISIDFPMNVRSVISHPNLKDNAGKTAIERGPIVYCAESADNEGSVLDMSLAADPILVASFEKNALNNFYSISGNAFRGKETEIKKTNIKLIPYYAWSHRGEGEMSIWFDQEKKK